MSLKVTAFIVKWTCRRYVTCPKFELTSLIVLLKSIYSWVLEMYEQYYLNYNIWLGLFWQWICEWTGVIRIEEVHLLICHFEIKDKVFSLYLGKYTLNKRRDCYESYDSLYIFWNCWCIDVVSNLKGRASFSLKW